MVHPCAACHLRFASTGELRDHIRAEHVELHEAVTGAATAASRRHGLAPDSFTRSGWVSPTRARPEPAAEPDRPV